jgi:hypothetical protein
MSGMFVKKQTTVQHAILRSHIGLLYDSLYISFFDKEKEITCKLARYLKRQNEQDRSGYTYTLAFGYFAKQKAAARAAGCSSELAKVGSQPVIPI